MTKYRKTKTILIDVAKIREKCANMYNEDISYHDNVNEMSSYKN